MRLGFSYKIVAFGWVLGVALSPTCAFGQKAAEWTYQGAEGPNDWGKLDPAFATCAVGQTQSPIDIKNAKKSDLPPLKFDYKAVPLNIIDKVHTVQVNYARVARSRSATKRMYSNNSIFIIQARSTSTATATIW